MIAAKIGKPIDSSTSPLRVLREPPVDAIEYIRDSIAQIVESFRYLDYGLLVSQIIRDNTWKFAKLEQSNRIRSNGRVFRRQVMSAINNARTNGPPTHGTHVPISIRSGILVPVESRSVAGGGGARCQTCPESRTRGSR